MITPEYCRLFASYNAWFNERLFSLSAALPDEKRRHGASCSLHDTLQHLLWGDAHWVKQLVLFDGPEPSHLYPTQQLTFEQLRYQRKSLDNALLAWAAKVDMAFLDADASYLGSDGIKRVLTKSLWIVQMFNHQTHYRGQAATLLRQHGIDIGVTDIYWAPGAIRRETIPA
ncbi:DinB family protein [Chitinivorax sp. B]|uniref:DinB family protein n=1 Tax=Chitinivorax sp. B TaxID=2502235 RepID=UPI001485A80A|nr:DinB family protein [Chitinivorax sp. B]